jgi:hypothetical protein
MSGGLDDWRAGGLEGWRIGGVEGSGGESVTLRRDSMTRHERAGVGTCGGKWRARQEV